jgi:putative methyltransferase (TIGR04325 family)
MKTVKALAKSLMPEILLQLFRSFWETRYRMRQTYSGAYAAFEDVAKVGRGYEDDDWPVIDALDSRSAIARNDSGFIPAAVSNEAAFLPLLVAVSRAARILEFGGATGIAYIAAKYGAMRGIDRYVVVEHPNVCVQGRELFKGDASSPTCFSKQLTPETAPDPSQCAPTFDDRLSQQAACGRGIGP